MTPKAALRFLLWIGEKYPPGDDWDEEDITEFHTARNVSQNIARLTMNLKPVHYAYTPGQSYEELLKAVK